MGSGGRADAVEHARLLAAVLVNAVSARPGWLAEVNGNLAWAMAATPRMRARLLALAATNGAGDPAALPPAARWLAMADAPLRRKAAAYAGLTYHLTALGPVLDQGKRDALVEALGGEALEFGLRHVALSHASETPISIEDYRDVIAADGARILELWADELGPAAVWLPRLNPDPQKGSVAVSRPAARAIAEAVLGWLSSPQGRAQ